MRFKCFTFFLFLLFTLSATLPLFSQFRDFRNATLVKSSGDSIKGKVSYKLNFHKRDTILFKDGSSEQTIPVSELKKILFKDGEIYTSIFLKDTTRKKVLARTLIDGGISLHKAKGLYYIMKDTSIFKLDNRDITVKRGSNEYSTPSKKYLTALNLAFIDCQTLDYKPLAKKMDLKSLMKLTQEYSKCTSIAIKNVRRKPSIEIAFSAGLSGLKLNSDFITGTGYNSGKGSSYVLSLLHDFGSSGRFKIRLDVNYFKSEINSAFTRTTERYWPLGVYKEYVTCSTGNNGFRIPLGMQYYFYNNTSGLYISGGLFFEISKYRDLDVNGNEVYTLNNKTIYEPTFHDHFRVKQGPIAGPWLALGGDIELNTRLKLNIEIRALKSFYEVTIPVFTQNRFEPQSMDMSVSELNPSLGLKYKLR